MISDAHKHANFWIKQSPSSVSSPRHRVSKHHVNSSNPTPSTTVDRCQTGLCKTPVFWRLARLEKRLDFRCATRNTGAAIRHAPSQHGRYRNPKQLARNAKNPCKTRVLQGLPKANGEDRNRTFRCFPNVSGMLEGYLLTLAYADNKPVAVARLGEYLDF